MRPISEAPHDTRILIWNADANCHSFGKVFRYPDGDELVVCEGYYGTWKCTGWWPLPDPKEAQP